MNEIISINYNNTDRPTVSGRELHEALEIETPYHKWFPRMTEYGFTEDIDYSVTDIFVPNSKGGKQTHIDHQITIDMAKELCMIQRSEKGKQFRMYFIEVENQWNTPEAVMARALQMANRQLESIRATNIKLTQKNETLTKQVDVLTSETLEWADRNIINAMVRRYAARALNNNFSQAWVDFKKELLYKYGININARITKYHNNTGKKCKPRTLDMISDEELPYALKTLVAMCNEIRVDIDDLLQNKTGLFNKKIAVHTAL